MPRWSESELRDYENRHKIPRAVAQPIVCHEPVAAKEGKGSNSKRLHVRVVSYRRRLCDADNLCPKYFIDCLRYAEVIKDDSAKFITLEVKQERVASSDQERTEIEIL